MLGEEEPLSQLSDRFEEASRKNATPAITVAQPSEPLLIVTMTQSEVSHRSVTSATAKEAFGRPLTPPINKDKRRLIYHIDKVIGVRRLCISQSIVKDVLDIAHTAEGYMGFARCYERVISS